MQDKESNEEKTKEILFVWLKIL